MDILNEITGVIRDETELFEEKLGNLIKKEDNFLKKELTDFIFSGSKRLRSVLVFLMSKILEIKDENVLKIALTVELIHNASLIHDDILDNAKQRRNSTTFNENHGAKIAVLEGDLLLSLALEELGETSLEIVKIFAKGIKQTLNGEINQNLNRNKVTDEESYLKRTFDKTGNLFLAGTISLFTLKKTDEATKNALLGFIKNFATAFQIDNDIKNFYEDGSDFTTGNYTLAVIYFFKENKTEDITKDKVVEYIDSARKKREEFKNTALGFLKDIKDSTYKQALVKIRDYTLRS